MNLHSFGRIEDDRLTTGRGQYVDDLAGGACFAVFVRSLYASARIVSIDTEAARAHPGVVAAFVGSDIAADGVDPCRNPLRFPMGEGDVGETPRPLLAQDRVRFAGESVAVVIAQTQFDALNAAELVAIDYEPGAAVVDVETSLAPDAPLVWPDRPRNLAYEWRLGDSSQVDAAFSKSARVVKLKSRVSRVTAAAMEPRSALAYLGDDGRPVLRLSHQSPHLLRNELATIFALRRDEFRIIAGDVGGSFGMKSGALREELVIFWAARKLGRAVRWTATRGESFLADDQGRDVNVTAELGLDGEGRFTGLRVRYDSNIGAYLGFRSTVGILHIGGVVGVYTIPVVMGEVVGHFSHQPPTSAYRGAGRPEATYTIERLIDVAAAETGIDPAELRRRNLIPRSAMPYKTPFVFTYDCGEFERNMDRALELSAYADFPRRREESRSRGRLRGMGLANPIEVAGGPYKQPATDWSTLHAHPDGSVSVVTGTMSAGQGHETALTLLAARELSIPVEKVKYVAGDTDAIANGKGNGGSGGLVLGGVAVGEGVRSLIEAARAIAATELEVGAADLEYDTGGFRVVGSDITITLAKLAAIRERDGAVLTGAGSFTPSKATFPNGCHVCEVEIDPETGAVEVLRYVSVEDVGRVVNRELVDGQIHGGIAQGIGQALLEEVRYDEHGQLLTGSFLDYAMPRASDMPTIVCDNPETPTELNPLGVKGVGEAGTVGALAATMNAVCNALLSAGVRHLDMPATPARVWQALQDAAAGRVHRVNAG